MLSNHASAITDNSDMIRNSESSGQLSEQKLREVSQEFEVALTSSLLKESLKNAFSGGLKNEESTSSTYTSFACEQISRQLGREGILGISDLICEDLKQHL